MELGKIVPWGWSFDEHRRMLSLTENDLAGPVLCCGDGPASFNAEAIERGFSVVSCDPIYVFSAAEIEIRVGEIYDDLLSQLKREPDRYVWFEFRDPDDLGHTRMAAMRRFLGDFESGRAEGRYVAASLPNLPFPDGRFRLAIVSHLLFLYSGHLDLGFHLAALDELLRVADEVRVFPLLTLAAKGSPHVEPVLDHLERIGHQAEIIATAYEFQKADDHAGNRMLRVRSLPPATPSGSLE